MVDGSRNIQTAWRRRCTCKVYEQQPTQAEAALLQEVLYAVRRICHGQVQIHIQDGRVIQIDHTEKYRLASR